MKKWTILLLMAVLVACQPTADYTDEMAVLDSLKTGIEALEPGFRAIDKDALQAMVDTAMAHVGYIQRNYEGSMRDDLALLVDKYRSLRKLLPDLGKRYNRALAEIDSTKIQLATLKDAMAKGANTDATGRNMSAEYYEKAMAEEKRTAESLLSELKLITERSEVLRERFDSLMPKVKYFVDSIPERKK